MAGTTEGLESRVQTLVSSAGAALAEALKSGAGAEKQVFVPVVVVVVLANNCINDKGGIL